MKLAQLAQSPKLIKITIDDEDTIKEFGEPIEFMTYDRQPLDIFMKLASVDHTNPSEMIKAITPLILDDKGVNIIQGDKMIPINLLVKVVTKISTELGNSLGQL